MNKETALAILRQAGVFYYNSREEAEKHGGLKPDEPFQYELNQNDTWGWACAMGEVVPDDKLVEVAGLYARYGYCGIVYWVSEQNNQMRSEFEDINRFVDFVRQEERHRASCKSSSEAAYKPLLYTLGTHQPARKVGKFWRWFWGAPGA